MSCPKPTHLFASIVLLILFNGCATLFSSYEYSVDLKNAPENIKVYDINNVEIPISHRRDVYLSYETRKYEPLIIKTISLRKNKEHTLILKSEDKEQRVTVYPKIGAGWLIVDVVTGLFPVFIDAYTGNWHYFDNINVVFEK